MQNQHFDTQAVHAGFRCDPGTGSVAVPIHQTSAYLYKSSEYAARIFELKELGWIYTRLQNPTLDVFEQRMAALEGGIAGVATASGQQAEFIALFNLARCGDHIISSGSLYGGTVSLLKNTFKRMGVDVTFVDMTNPESMRKAFKPNTKAVYFEALANPKNEVLEYAEIARIGHEYGVPVICDNTALTPALFKPFEHGVDIVLASATKMLGGHGTSMGGIVVDSGRFDWGAEPKKWPQFTEPDDYYHGMNFHAAFGNLCYAFMLRTHWLRDFGGCMSPFNASLILQGLETLHLRASRCAQAAQTVAEFLAGHPKVSWVNYPGLPSHPGHALAQKYLPKGCGAILGFGIKGGKAAGQKFIESVELALHVANIGDARTLVIHPATTTHSQLNAMELRAAGVPEDYIRVSIGLEAPEDVIADLDQALGKAAD
ncbi:MAG TPA: bifunctional O-acetylhomoserine aminocarboxypropyltransferase/cysteine synthase [Planctomycetaceae bacterium]|nr:bifunctional O-acetylhomoserine aminocarboxypropyltransferase/cysteine synthase [Planctomycetaceae bacterium]